MSPRTRSPRPWSPQVLSALLLVAGAALSGCTGGSDETPTPDADGETELTAEEEAAAAADPARLVARLQPVGPAGEAPRQLVVRLRRDVFPSDAVGGEAGEGTQVEITPPLPGALRVDARDALVFEPESGFRPGTEYTAKVVSVQTDEGPLEAPDGGWTTTFETPDFALARTAIWKRDLQRSTLDVDLAFTAAVDPDAVASKVRFELDGDPVRPARVQAGPRDSVVRVRFQGRRFAQDGTLAIALGSGVAWSGDGGVTAPGEDASLELRTGPPLEIEALVVKEGANGHYLDVVCKDPGAGGERWWWDPDTYDGWWVTRRCLPMGDSATAAITVSPAVDFSLAEGPAGFRLFGDFSQGEYTVTLGAGLTTVDGGMMGETWEGRVRVPQRTPRIRFASKGRYLPRSAWNRLAVRHLNTGDAELIVRHIPEQNLVFWLSGDSEDASARVSEVVLREPLTLSGEEDVEATRWVDVGSLLPDAGRGVYEVEVRSGDARDAARLLLTDMHLVAKRARLPDSETTDEEVVVWAVGAHDNTPRSGVEVKLVRASGLAIDTCRTASDGSCRLEVAADRTDKAAPFALLASRAGDLTYLKFSDLQLQSDADTTGVAWSSPDDGPAYRAATWTDRGVYRPGETAHVGALVRNAEYAAPDAGLPVVAHLVDPRGKELRKVVVETDATGMVTMDLPFADFATTGRYRVSMEVAERNVGEASFNVEEFVPERMAVEATVEGEDHLVQEPVPVDIEGRWLFGGSASGSPVEATCRLVPAPFEPKKNASYHFGLVDMEDRTLRAMDLGTVKAELDEDGKARVVCPAPATSGGWLGPAAIVASVEVFEGQSGRSTKARARAAVHPGAHYLGVRANADTLKEGQTLKVDGLVVDHGGARTDAGPTQVSLRIDRLDAEYGWWWDDEDESSSYRRLLRRTQVETRTVDVSGGKYAFEYTASSGAEGFLFTISSDEATTELRLDGAGRRYFWSPRDRSVDQTPRPARATPLEVVAPADIAVGEAHVVTVTAPYAGRMLFSVEADRVLRWEWREVQPGPVEFEMRVDAFRPTVYASALLLKDPHLESEEAFLPDRAHGVAPIRVRPDAWSQKVSLTVPDEIRPYSTLEVGLKVDPAEGPVMATIAVVDEGVLQLTDFETPDPAKTIFAKRGLGTRSYETVGWSLLMEPGGPSSTTGGGADGAGGRVQMVKPVALWSGPVEVGPDGTAKVSFDIPGYRGKLRVMAVTAGKTRMGHAEADVTVRDPIVIQTTLPRFLVAGDLASIPVFVSNMSGKARSVKVSLEIEDIETTSARSPGAEGRVPVADTVGEREGTLELAEGESGTVVFRVTARRAPAAARFRVVATADDLVSKEELELPVAPANPEDTRMTRVALTGTTVDLDAALASQGWMPGADRTTFWITANPYADALTHLQALIRYPYGCIEQTTSSTRPLLVARDLMPSIDPDRLEKGGVDEMVAAGVERVMSMQTAQGGFAYWPGSSRPSLWGTAYATHMLLDAKKAGFDVAEGPLKDALDYLDREVGGRADGDPDGTQAYAHFVLARAGRGLPAQAQETLERYDEKPKKWRYYGRNLETRTLLMTAMYLSGDRRHESALRDLDTSTITGDRRNTWSFYSDLRRRGMVLALYQDAFGVDDKGGVLADKVADALRTRSARYYTTQELAWGVTALGQRVQAAGSKAPAVTLTLDGAERAPATETPSGERTFSVVGATGVEDLSLALSSDPGGSAWLITTVNGVRARDDLAIGGEGLRLERSFHGEGGAALDESRHQLGDRIYVRTTISNTTKERIQNIALVDRIPAGWELENPRLGGADVPDWVDTGALWRAEHMNLRDDRLEVFGELKSGESRSVVYVARAVTSGTFHVPDVRAEAMYDPDQWAREVGGEIEIQGPWADFQL
jgi:alpha-2-macroglobulin